MPLLSKTTIFISFVPSISSKSSEKLPSDFDCVTRELSKLLIKTSEFGEVFPENSIDSWNISVSLSGVVRSRFRVVGSFVTGPNFPNENFGDSNGFCRYRI